MSSGRDPRFLLTVNTDLVAVLERWLVAVRDYVNIECESVVGCTVQTVYLLNVYNERPLFFEHIELILQSK